MSDIYQFNVGGTTYNLANLGLLAPVQITLTADRLYNTGDQFIYTGLLYEATETIAQGTSITIGSNAQLADCVTKQISEINSNLSKNQFDSAIDLSSYNSSSSLYTFPCDGYVQAYADTDGSTYDNVLVYVLGRTSSSTPIFVWAKSLGRSGGTGSANLFVRKGMRCYVSDSGTLAGSSAVFVPLIS